MGTNQIVDLLDSICFSRHFGEVAKHDSIQCLLSALGTRDSCFLFLRKFLLFFCTNCFSSDLAEDQCTHCHYCTEAQARVRRGQLHLWQRSMLWVLAEQNCNFDNFDSAWFWIWMIWSFLDLHPLLGSPLKCSYHSAILANGNLAASKRKVVNHAVLLFSVVFPKANHIFGFQDIQR